MRVTSPVLLGILILLLGATDPSPLGAQPLEPGTRPSPPAPASATDAPSDDPQVEFRVAENTFRYQDYPAAVEKLEALLYPEVLLAEEDEIRAREYLGASHWWLKGYERAEEEFTSLLTRRPDYRLDAFYYPAALIVFFDGVREKLVRLRVIPSGEGPPPTEGGGEPRVVRERVIEEKSLMLCFFPFGVGQFQNGHTTKGIIFLTAEVLALATNIASYFVIDSLREGSGFIASENIDRARSFEIVLYVSLGVFAAVTIGGIVDALVHFEPRVETVRELPVPADPAGTSFRVAPTVYEGGAGFDFELRF